MPTIGTMSPEFFALQAAVAGRYSLVRELGRGGMGIVFLARDVALDRPVAIKLLPPELAMSAEHRERFVREARMAARLSHPHIVPIHAVEDRGEVVFFVMAFIDGDTLGGLVERDGPLGSPEATRIAREVAWALGHAHSNGVVHRDVKPDNILIERGSRRAIVTDFGIARAADGPNTSGAGRVVGTPKFMSPEQGAGDQVDGRSDIYSLGAVAYYTVVGRVPFEGRTAAAVLVRHLNDPVPSVRSANPAVAPRLAGVIERCLAKDPQSRFASADELALSLRDAVGGPAPAVQAFLRATETVGAEIGTALSAIVSSGFLVAYVISRESSAPDFGDALSLTVAMVLFMGAMAAMAGLGVVRLVQVVDQAKRLLRAGYGHSAVRPAIVADLAERGEALVEKPSRAGVVLRVAGTIGAVWLTRFNSGWLPLVGAAGAVAIPTIALNRVWIEKRLWARGMAGWFGKLVFKVASIGKTRGIPSTPAAGEPTAIAIGHAASDLFDALPEETRQKYPELPALIARLEANAVGLSAAGGDQVDDRFTVAVAALESLRLDLLRLHASAAGASGLTGDVSAVERIGGGIEAQIQAAEEVARFLDREVHPLK